MIISKWKYIMMWCSCVLVLPCRWFSKLQTESELYQVKDNVHGFLSSCCFLSPLQDVLSMKKAKITRRIKTSVEVESGPHVQKLCPRCCCPEVEADLRPFVANWKLLEVKSCFLSVSTGYWFWIFQAEWTKSECWPALSTDQFWCKPVSLGSESLNGSVHEKCCL